MPPQNADVAVAPDYTALLMGLAMNCPMGQDNPVACPLHSIRDRTLVQRFEWAKSRTREEAANLVGFHKYCCPRMK